MSIIDQLIQMKKQTKNEDILHVMDELSKYEKLSKLPAFQDIQHQTAIQKKIPFLWKAMQQDVYAQALLLMAGHMCSHLTGQTPPFIATILADMTDTHQRRLELMQQSAITISYCDLSEYNNEIMADTVVATYSEKRKHDMAILIITYQTSEYIVFQGYYNDKEIIHNVNEIPYYTCHRDNCEIRIQTYSLQGNNAYPFGHIYLRGDTFNICMPDSEHIHLQPQQQQPDGDYVDSDIYPCISISLTQAEQNKIVMSLPHIEDFASAILDIICSEEEQQ